MVCLFNFIKLSPHSHEGVGEYEGLLTSEILQRNPGWDGWKDGCELYS